MGHRNRLIAAALFLGNLIILGPFFLAGYSNQPWNNSYVYMAIARMFRDHKWTWNPLQYAGAPFHYLYPPVFQVLVASVPFVDIGHAFHIVTACAYALVPACLYFLALALFESPLLAGLSAVAYSVFPSPVYYALAVWKGLAIPYGMAPWGFVAMIGYEEAAHAFALSFTLLAITAAWKDRWGLTACLAAIVFLTNWPAMIGLGLALSAIAVRRKIMPLVGAVGTAYGLAAFWMTPGYFVSSTLLNRIVISNTNPGSPVNRTTAIILGCSALVVMFSLWKRVPAALALVLSWVAVLGAVVVSFSLVGNNLVPMPNRYMLEFNAGCILAIVGVLSLMPLRARMALAVVVFAAGSWASRGFIAKAWTFQQPEADPKTFLTAQISEWLKQHAGSTRVLASGELDSTLALWSDVPQIGGTGQDVSNFLMFAAQKQVTFGCAADSSAIAELWLKALNIHYFVVHEGESREYFHWFAQAEKFRNLPVAWDNGAGDRIYEIRDAHEAVVVDLSAMGKLPALRSTDDAGFLKAYVAWAAGKRTATVRWSGDDSFEAGAALGPGEAILLKTTYDRGWGTEGDPLGFTILRRTGRYQFHASWDVWLARLVTAMTVILLLARVSGWKIAAVAVVPSVLAFLWLLSSVPATAAVAQQAFTRLQPPLINAGGMVNNGQGIISVYGSNFGSDATRPHVFAGDREAAVTYHGKNLIVFKVPPGSPSRFPVSVEVNACRGNAFVLQP